MASIEDYEQAGLFDARLHGETGRLELLQWLSSLGFSIEEMVTGLNEGALGAMAGDRLLQRGDRREVAEAARNKGIDPDRLRTLAIAAGFAPRDPAAPSEIGVNAAEVGALNNFMLFSQIFSEEEALGFLRVIGSAMARVAEASVALFLSDIEGPLLARHSSELEIAKHVENAVKLLDDLVPMLDPILRRQVQQSVERSRMSIIDEMERLQFRYAVGFIDLVGFTPITRNMSAKELGVFHRNFERWANDAVNVVGARLVKLIGDEIMFVAPDADSACRVAQTLMAGLTTEQGGSVVPRGGLAYGDVLVRGGDYFGDVVTVASRLVDEAAPWELLVSDSFATAATCMSFEPSSPRMLKGFSDPVEVCSALFET